MISIDADILVWINGHGCDWMDGLMLFVTERNTWIPLYIALIAALLMGYRETPSVNGREEAGAHTRQKTEEAHTRRRTVGANNKKWRWMAGVIAVVSVVLAVTVADFITSSLIKPWVERLRPCHEPALAEQVRIVRDYMAWGYSFPSSHASSTMAVATSALLMLRWSQIGNGWRNVWRVVMVSYVVLNCYSRMYLAAHYPTDIAVGIACGAIAGIAFAYLGRWIIALRGTRIKGVF